MKFAAVTISLLICLAVLIEARDNDIDEEPYKLKRTVYCPRFERKRRCEKNGCERSCSHPGQSKNSNCEQACNPYSCQCKKGFYRDNQGTGRCVPYRKCKK